VAPAPKPNTCGLVSGTENATGLAKVIGGPFCAELLNVNVTDLSSPTVTLPKLPDGGLIIKLPGTGVGVEVGVGVFKGAAFPTPLSDICCGAFEALSLIVRVSNCSPFAAGLKRTPTSHLRPARMLVPQVLLTTLNCLVPVVILVIVTAPLLVLGVASSISFALLLVPNVWVLKLTVEGEKFIGPIGTALGVAVGVAV